MFRSKRNGLTLIELLVIIAIIAILIAFLVPMRRNVREAAARTQCVNNLKQMMMAMHAFADTKRSLPNPSTQNTDSPVPQMLPPGCFGPGQAPEERLSWIVALLPYLDQDPLYQRFDMKKGYADNGASSRTQLITFLCPELKKAGSQDAVTNYIAMSGIGRDAAFQPADAVGNGFMGYDRVTSMKMITDGTSNTIGLMETQFDLGPWARGGGSTLRAFDPADLPLSGDGRPFGGPSGTMVAMTDGTVRFLVRTIDPKVLAAAITIAGGESVDLDSVSR